MSTQRPTGSLTYSWSLDLKGVLDLDDFTISWITTTTHLIIGTGIGGTERCSEGPTTVHFIEVPTHYLRNATNEPDLVVLEITRIDDMIMAHLRPAFAGAEPVRDVAMAGASS